MKKTFDIWSMNCERLYALRKKGTSFLYYDVDNDLEKQDGFTEDMKKIMVDVKKGIINSIRKEFPKEIANELCNPFNISINKNETIHYDTLQYAKLFDDKLEAEEELELIKENGFDTSDLEIVELSIIIEVVDK